MDFEGDRHADSHSVDQIFRDQRQLLPVQTVCPYRFSHETISAVERRSRELKPKIQNRHHRRHTQSANCRTSSHRSLIRKQGQQSTTILDSWGWLGDYAKNTRRRGILSMCGIFRQPSSDLPRLGLGSSTLSCVNNNNHHNNCDCSYLRYIKHCHRSCLHSEACSSNSNLSPPVLLRHCAL